MGTAPSAARRHRTKQGKCSYSSCLTAFCSITAVHIRSHAPIAASLLIIPAHTSPPPDCPSPLLPLIPLHLPHSLLLCHCTPYLHHLPAPLPQPPLLWNCTHSQLTSLLCLYQLICIPDNCTSFNTNTPIYPIFSH